MKYLYLLIVLLFINNNAQAQSSPFNIYLEPMNINGLGGLQSYAYAQHNGKWLIVGGRLDGMHRRQPFAAFDVAGNNNQLRVVDPVAGTTWSQPISSLSTNLQEQLSSTNMAFYQSGNYLYLVGGYGYHNATASRKTFNFITAIDVPATINAIINNASFTNYFRQQEDTTFGVTGGHLKKVDATYYLAGGNRFDGNYNPMGNPTYVQAYTNAVRRFTLSDNGTTLTINHLPAWINANEFHRRDYNAVAQILPGEKEGVTMFSGVFQPTIDLPFLGSVTFDSAGYAPDANFQQYYNHYHCGVLPVYSALQQEMHSVFFGGIAQYYDNGGTLTQDNQVPFVKTIARVTRTANGTMSEHKLPLEMPAFIGAGAEMIPIENIPHYNNHVIKLDSLTADTTHVAYLYGGINSSAANIFMSNDGTQSTALSDIYKVFIIKNKPMGIDQFNVQSRGSLQLQVYPVQGQTWPKVHFVLNRAAKVNLRLLNQQGQLLYQTQTERLNTGARVIEIPNDIQRMNSHYIIHIEANGEKASLQISPAQ